MWEVAKGWPSPLEHLTLRLTFNHHQSQQKQCHIVSGALVPLQVTFKIK